MRKFQILILAAFFLLSAAAFGQATSGSIAVTVLDSDGGAIPGALVEASSPDTLSRRTVQTGQDGKATLTALSPADNYTLFVRLDGFNGYKNEAVRIVAGQTVSFQVQLSLAAVTEELIVTSEAPVVDVTNTISGQDITLELTESLPTNRSYQDYLQLVPGVQSAVVDDFGNNNPASRSGMNYQDIAGSVGDSRDNFYYFEGIDVTDGVSGVAGAFLNTEIIQEQSVLTGGLPAEYVGASGLVSNVITKSGGNDFSGSVNYYFQNDGLVEDNTNREDAGFSTFDTAFTLGGPIVRDKAWFFASFRMVNREQDVVDPDGNFLRTVERDDEQGFAKVTYAPTESGLLTGIFLSDPFEIDGSFNDQTTTLRDTAAERGGARFTVTYSHVWSSLVLDLGFADHDRDVNNIPASLETRNDVNFRNADVPGTTLDDQQKGGGGTSALEERSGENLRGSLEYLADTSWGSHSLKFGVEMSEKSDLRNSITTGDGGIYNSLDLRYLDQGVTAGEVGSDFFDVDFSPENPNDVSGLNTNAPAHIIDLLDTDNNGTVSAAEAAAIEFGSTFQNPHGLVNYDRFFQLTDGALFTRSEGTTYYVQDQWQHGNWSVNLGMRAEEWKHFASTGERVFTFDFEYAPRVSVVYDLLGDGQQRLSFYYGRYYDPIRNNMTNFAGSLSGRERAEQVFVTTDAATGEGEWVTYRIRGGARKPDASFVPTTQTPYTDEWELGYKVDFGRNMSLEANLIRRETNDVLEDYDLPLFTNPETYGLPIDHPDSLFLGLEPFGFSEPPEANFFISTLFGGEREWDGAELVFRKRMSNHWQMLASYNFADAEGNTNSDSNADFQGDLLYIDPRAIHQFATQPGLVEHLFKIAGTYRFDNGLSLGGTYRWNSGSIVSRTRFRSGRNLPLEDVNDPLFTGEPIVFAGGSAAGIPGEGGEWLSPFAVGQFENPSFGVVDLRVAYLWKLGNRLEADFFLDIFNALDDQDVTRAQDLISGRGGVDFGEGLDFVDPRRYFLGARLRF